MKYILFDKRDDGQIFTEEFENKEEAIRMADITWERYITDTEKRHIVEFYVLESVNPDEDAEDHWDGNYAKLYLIRQEKKHMEVLFIFIYGSAAIGCILLAIIFGILVENIINERREKKKPKNIKVFQSFDELKKEITLNPEDFD